LSDENPNIADADGAPISDLSDSGRWEKRVVIMTDTFES
jgi:hypothetical protein